MRLFSVQKIVGSSFLSDVDTHSLGCKLLQPWRRRSLLFICIVTYRGVDKSLARSTSRCILFDG